MERKWKKKRKERWRTGSGEQGLSCPGNSSSNADVGDSHEPMDYETSRNSAASAGGRSRTDAASCSQSDRDRTKPPALSHRHTQHKEHETCTGAEQGRQQSKKQKGRRWRDASNNDSHYKSPGFSSHSQGSWQDESERHTGDDETQTGHRRPRHCKKKHQGDYRHDREACNQTARRAGGSKDVGSDDKHNNEDSSQGAFGDRKIRKRPSGAQRRKRQSSDWQYESGSGPSGGSASNAAAASNSLEIPGFYYDPEKKRYFKIQSSNYVEKDDKSAITYESIRKKQAETQRQKDVAAFEAGSKQKCVPYPPRESVYHRRVHHSLSSMLLHGYQRGEVDRSTLERTWIHNCASQLQHTDTIPVSPIFPNELRAEHMQQMEVSQDHGQLLCLWSLSGTTVQRLKLLNVHNSPSQSRKLSVRFTACDGGFQSWDKITSLCWCEFPQHPGKKFALYTTMCHTGQVSSVAVIRCLETAPAGFDHQSYSLGRPAVWTCAWNYHRQQFGVGTEKGCYIVDARTRLKWQFNTLKSDVLAQVFSKEDGGKKMYTGIRRGSILLHDLRTSNASPVCHSKMNHLSSVCCLRLSPEENYVYASDFLGGIKKWDLRMQKEVLTYSGLFNLQCKLPFHIDESQSLLYAAGQDCYSKIWCLKTGKLLLTIPPPYEASLYFIPVVRFSTRWGRSPGNVGLIMGGHEDIYVYSLQNCEE
ncbi:DDB1- and CUL4-associated factor 4-like [Babylonia areolata]|uniref:DDB1- and CUL4-associated factor 4-like n=1 Tax=Babylonia areolata TaxID=304850 RepID=UPI003FD06E1C